MGGDDDVPDIPIQNFGYMYLAGTQTAAEAMITNQQLQAEQGAGTQIMSPDQIAERYPFYNLDGILLGSHNTVDEGYFDGGTVFDWWRKQARQAGVEMLHDEVVDMTHDGRRVTALTLASGAVITPGEVVNASGPRCAAPPPCWA